MEAEDESTGYFKLFNDGPHNNYLLQSSEDGLNDVESIFGLTADWSTEALPILFSGPLIADVNNENESISTNAQLLTGENETTSLNEELKNGNAVAFFSNDVFLKVEEGDSEDNEELDGNTYAISYEQQPVSSEKEVIQLLNIDGTITTINIELLNSAPAKNTCPKLERFYFEVKANKCKLCSFLSETVQDISNHLMAEHAKEIGFENHEDNQENIIGTKMTSILNVNKNKQKYTMFLCSGCGNAYSNKEDLKQHMITQHKMINNNTSSPEETISIESEPPPIPLSKENDRSRCASAASLIKKQKTNRRFRCSIKGCSLRFQNQDVRIQHENCHVNQEKRQFMCPVCKEKFSIWRICNIHLWRNHKIDLGLLSCPICNNYKSNSELRMVSHMAIHSDDKPFICSFCGKSFKQLNQLRNHEIYHKNPDEIPDFLTKKKCEQCERFFANSKSLKKHIKFVHDKFKPFICNICGYQSSRKEILQSHHRQHTGDKPYHCNYCEFKTGDRNCLRRHVMRHFGAVKYSCPYCTYQSIQASSYKKHLANKHPGKEGSHTCTVCKYTSVNWDSYLVHIKCHELETKKQTNGNVDKAIEDNESKSSDETHTFLNAEHSEEAVVDTDGITIPATFDLNVSLL